MGEGGGSPFCPGISLHGGRKKGWGREDWEKRERGESNPPHFEPSSLSPTPFDACYAGYLGFFFFSKHLSDGTSSFVT